KDISTNYTKKTEITYIIIIVTTCKTHEPPLPGTTHKSRFQPPATYLVDRLQTQVVPRVHLHPQHLFSNAEILRYPDESEVLTRWMELASCEQKCNGC